VRADKQAIRAGVKLGEVKEAFGTGGAGSAAAAAAKQFGGCELQPVDEGARQQFLGNCTWFYANFMDAIAFPALIARVDAPTAAGAGGSKAGKAAASSPAKGAGAGAGAGSGAGSAGSAGSARGREERKTAKR
jgi:hypothetical protein